MLMTTLLATIFSLTPICIDNPETLRMLTT